MIEPLDVFADLTLTVDGEDIIIDGSGAIVTIHFPTLSVAFKVLRTLRQHTPLTSLLDALSTASYQSNFLVSMTVKGQSVASFSPERSPGLLSRLLRLPYVKIRPIALLKAMFTRS